MAFNLLPLELLPLIIQHLPISSLSALSRTCRSLNTDKFLTAAIDVYITCNAHYILKPAALSDCPATMRRCLDIDPYIPSGFLVELAQKASGRTLQVALNYGASLDEPDRYGFNSLERAVRCGNVDGARVLLAAGASPVCDDRLSLMDVARWRRYPEMEELLLQFWA